MSAKVVLSLALAALLGSAVVSCTLAIDLDPLSAGCAEDEKLCPPEDGAEPACVKISPKYGCGRPNCVVCSPPFAESYCLPDGACGVGACNGDHEDCNGDPVDGCEIDLDSNANNCGACNTRCDLANATPGCNGGNCVIISCKPGWKNCDGTMSAGVANGCETNTTIYTNCGDCGVRCDTTVEDCIETSAGVFSCVPN